MAINLADLSTKTSLAGTEQIILNDSGDPKDVTVDTLKEHVRVDLLPEIENYTALRAYTGPVTAYYVRGVANIFDGGAGVFRVDASDTTTADNGGTVLVDASGRRWKREFSGAVNVRWFGCDITGVSDGTDAINAAALASSGVVDLPKGTIRYTRIIWRSGVVFRGAGSQNTFLVCTDPSTMDAGASIGSSFRKLDDGQRVFRAGITGVFLSTGSAGTGSNQAVYQNIAALNLCACERTFISDVAFAGFGQGAIIFARAEAGAEGLGFVNTTQDGNYNYVSNISIGSCGAYNEDTCAIWFKYKANSNKLYGIFGKGLVGTYLFGIPRGNDNGVFGGTLESGKGVCVFGPGALASAAVSGGEVTSVFVDYAGRFYTSAPNVVFSGGGGSGATATATISSGGVTGITITNPGTGYSSAPSVSLVGGYSVDLSAGNNIYGMRIEGASGDGYVFKGGSFNNFVMGGYHTGVAGVDYRRVEGDKNRILSDNLNVLKNRAFPPATNYSTNHNLGALVATSINGDPDDPLYIKSKNFGISGSYPYVVMYNDVQAGAAGNILGRFAFRNGDTSTGAAGVSGAIDGVLEGSGGQTGLALYTGTGTTLTEYLRLTNTGVLRPGTDNTQTLGASANRWSVVHAGTGTINTSDEREKQDITALDDAERRVATSIKGMVKKFRFRDAVAEKGNEARIHIGVIAQEVIAAFQAEGLDPMRYGIICYDKWDDHVIKHEALYDHCPTGELDENGEEIYIRAMIRDAWTEFRPAGNRYGVRYEELMAFIVSAL